MTLQWRGDEVLAEMQKAERYGVNKTMAEAVEHAKRQHSFTNRTGTLEGSVAIADYAETDARGVTSGRWGSLDVGYALAIELGVSGTQTVDAHRRKITQVYGRPIAAKTITVSSHRRKVNRPARPFLRPAADAEYPNLAANIREGRAAR